MKVKVVAGVLVTSLCLSLSWLSFERVQSVDVRYLNTFPEKAEPFTVIECVGEHQVFVRQMQMTPSPENGSQLLVSQEIPPRVHTLLQKQTGFVYPPEEADFVLPAMVKGTRVEYGADGRPLNYFIQKPRIDPNEKRPPTPLSPNLAGQLVKGKFSFFGYQPDEMGFPLDKYGCATRIGFDQPPYNTTIFAKDLDTGKTAVLKKRSIGGLSPGTVLDVTPHVFQNVFGKRPQEGFIRNGVYYHD